MSRVRTTTVHVGAVRSFSETRTAAAPPATGAAGSAAMAPAGAPAGRSSSPRLTQPP